MIIYLNYQKNIIVIFSTELTRFKECLLNG